MKEKPFKCKAKGLENLSMELEEGDSNFMDIVNLKYVFMQPFAQSHPHSLFWFLILSIISKK